MTRKDNDNVIDLGIYLAFQTPTVGGLDMKSHLL